MPGFSKYPQLLAYARRHARRLDEAEDLVQEALIAAFLAGRGDLTVLANRRWMLGAIRKRAQYDARSAARRRRREALWLQGQAGTATPPSPRQTAAVLTGLPPALRVVAALALSGHNRREIAYLLGLSDTALRQRISALKRALAKIGEIRAPESLPGLHLGLAYGTLRDVLVPALHRHGGIFASHDPDGHLFVVRRSQKR